ncbi:MAG TPA: hypothetical protein VGD80_21070 [Kofleriaceae bacterium]
MRRMTKIGLVAIATLASSVALAQESEFQDKIQEDLDGYKSQIVSNCGTTDKLTLKWNGKLGSNPREIDSGAYSAVSTLCTSALEGVAGACYNKAVKKSLTKVTSVVCTKGSGTIGYSLKGATLTFTVDTKFDKNNAAGQRDDLVTKLKKDLDK